MTEKIEKEIETEHELQENCDKFVHNHVYCCQSSLVIEMLKKEIFSWEDVENQQFTYDAAIENGMFDIDAVTEEDYDLDPQYQEVYEWWVVSGWLLDELGLHNEPVLHNDYGDWWGRTTSGQAISMDYIIRKIYKDMMK